MKVTRARGYRLYYGDEKQRALDIALGGGSCLFGHDPRGLSVQYKNNISRGLYLGGESRLHAGVSRLIKDRFPGWRSLIYPTRAHLREELRGTLGIELTKADFHRFTPEVREYSIGDRTFTLGFWRPFAGASGDISSASPTASADDGTTGAALTPRSVESAGDAAAGRSTSDAAAARTWRSVESAGDAAAGFSGPDLLLPILPQPGNFAPQILLYRPGFAGEDLRVEPGLPVSPVMLAGLKKVLELLEMAERFACFGSVARLSHQPKKHLEALGVTRQWFAEEFWARYEPTQGSPWTRTGPYLQLIDPESVEDTWPRIIKYWRNAGLILPERPDYVIIIPSMLSRSESKLLRLFLEQFRSEIGGGDV